MFGVFDKVLCEVPDKSHGGLKKIVVSRNTFDNWLAQGKHVVELNGFKAFLYDPKGKIITHEWVEGHELTRGEYSKHKDTDGNVYGLICSNQGKKTIRFVKKMEWKQSTKTAKDSDVL